MTTGIIRKFYVDISGPANGTIAANGLFVQKNTGSFYLNYRIDSIHTRVRY